MNTVQQIEEAILQLSSEEFRTLADWLIEIDQRRWDEQFERDVQSGRLDALANEAIEDFKAGRTREI